MSERAGLLFKDLWNRKAIHALVGQSEDGDFDCKEWHGPDNTKASIAKAVCGFANATGGVIVIGMSAKGTGANSPDVVTGEKPVADAEAVKSAVLDIILKQVDPGVKGVQVHTVRDTPKSKSGFVLIYVPEQDGPPQRSKADWRFYVRIASGTVSMEYFQIEDRFGTRPHPRLELFLERARIGLGIYDQKPQRIFKLGLTNSGRGLAKFPSIRFSRSCGLAPDTMLGLDGNGNAGLPLRASEREWVIFRGGIDDVVYPMETLAVTFLVQAGAPLTKDSREVWEGPRVGSNPYHTKWRFSSFSFSCEISCEGMPTVEVERTFEEEDHLH